MKDLSLGVVYLYYMYFRPARMRAARPEGKPEGKRPIPVSDIKGLMILKNVFSCFKPSYRSVQISPRFL